MHQFTLVLISLSDVLSLQYKLHQFTLVLISLSDVLSLQYKLHGIKHFIFFLKKSVPKVFISHSLLFKHKNSFITICNIRFMTLKVADAGVELSDQQTCSNLYQFIM